MTGRASLRAMRLGGIVMALAILGGCANLPATHPGRAVAGVDRPFAVDGRLSARRGNDAVSGSFSWLHDPARDVIDLATPLGQTLARLEGNRAGVALTRTDGSVERAPDWATLTERGLGVAIPVEGLANWIQGNPRPGTEAAVERDDSGRLSDLRQDGWEVRYQYADAAAAHPKRVLLTYPGSPPIDVTIVVDRWE